MELTVRAGETGFTGYSPSHAARMIHGYAQGTFGDVQVWLPELVARVDAFYLDGFAPANNPRMIELPGSFSGMRISPSPERGPEASQRTSFAIFINEAASVFSPPLQKTISSCAESAANLFG